MYVFLLYTYIKELIECIACVIFIISDSKLLYRDADGNVVLYDASKKQSETLLTASEEVSTNYCS